MRVGWVEGRGRDMLDKIINRSSKDIQDIQVKLHSTAKMRNKASFPKLIKKDNVHDAYLQSVSPCFLSYQPTLTGSITAL